MELRDMLGVLSLVEREDEVRSVLATLPASAPADWRLLAAGLAVGAAGSEVGSRMRVLGIAGGQGAGKSTLARLVVQALAARSIAAAALSLDDFYLRRDERQSLAGRVHPLLATRGVPGTHDVDLCRETLSALRRPGAHPLPSFDKGTDDRKPRSGWPVLNGPLAVAVLEGWCLGVPPEPETRLAGPVNELEAAEDGDAVWRRYVNRMLAESYAALWQDVDYWVYLRVPDLAAVARWREQQEQDLPAERRMKRAALTRFIAHYERLTRWMFDCMPARSDLVVELDGDHRVRALIRGGRHSDSIQ